MTGRARRVLVTGADGFTGRHLVPLLARAGDEVVGLSRRLPEAPVAGLDGMIACDLADADSLARVVGDIRPDRVLHLAGVAFVAHGSPDAFYHVNLLGTRALLEACALQADRIDHCVLASSAQVYGPAEGIVSEDRAPRPANDYAVSKLAMEHVAGLYADRLSITLTRPFNYTGIGQSPSYLIPKIVDHVRRRAPIIELGNLDVERDFSDVRTVADIYARLLDRPAATGVPETLNICSGRGHALRDILAMACAAAGHAIDIRINPAFVRANEVASLVGDPGRLDRAIGPIDRPPLADTIRWMIETNPG